jgi:multicomponent Na+:H+ antiporter subunit G
MEITGNIIIIIGTVFIFFGIFGVLKFKNFYARILVASKIDTVGAFTIIAGLAVKHGFGFFSLKLMLLIILMMIINPLIVHMTARSAYLSGYKIDNSHSGGKEEKK